MEMDQPPMGASLREGLPPPASGPRRAIARRGAPAVLPRFGSLGFAHLALDLARTKAF